MIDLKPACRTMRAVLDGVSDAQLTLPTPCEKFGVGDLVDHVVGFTGAFTAVARGEAAAAPVAEPDASHLAADWRSTLPGRLGELGAAWDDPAAWEGAADAGVGLELPRALWGRIALTELVVHGWDLARATGQPFDVPEPTLRVCFDHVSTFMDGAPVEGLWGPPVEVARDAPLLHRLLGATGRRP
ncbi:TIGR03086 family metal-binding protein [Streptomyces sp. NPDC087440]|uniref:TIGR03086 family metal-binding protein n=1 Tax=Streptomyces sp. NPDC087440 TaxID=3365790 RepID=UPI0037FEB235